MQEREDQNIGEVGACGGIRTHDLLCEIEARYPQLSYRGVNL